MKTGSEVYKMATVIQNATFIEKIAPLIQREAKKRGYKVCSPIIAQACLESAFGTSSLGYKYHNYFGMKCGSKWHGKSVNMKTKEEYTVGTLTTIHDNFRAYDDMVSGVQGYFDFVSTPRYAILKTASTPQEYLERIKAAGYATSSSYVKNNMTVINKYNLTKYDSALSVSTSSNTSKNPYDTPTRTLKRGCKGADVRWLQVELNNHGYDLLQDGVMGIKTEAAVRDYQSKHGLVVDGLAGQRTIASLISQRKE